MKRKAISSLLTVAWFVFILNSCSDDSPDLDPTPKNEPSEPLFMTKGNARIQSSGQYINTDWSGQVETLTVYVDFGITENPSGYIQLSSDYVLIGGGAYTFDVGAGGLLVDTHPVMSVNTYYAKSKSHIDSDPHSLRIFAIGLKIQGVSPATLKSQFLVNVFSISQVDVNRPTWSVSLPSGFSLIGGGGEVYDTNPSWGNMLTESYPFSSNGWAVGSKDHINPDPAKIIAHAVGLKSDIPGFGLLDIVMTTATTSVATGYATVNIPKPFNDGFGYVNVGVGAKDNYSGWGRLLTGITPVGPNGELPWVKSKDHKKASGGTLVGYAFYVRKKP